MEYPKANVPIIYIDPNPALDSLDKQRVHVMPMKASEGLELLKQNLLSKTIKNY